ncbi:MAG TPA: mechanosensitive ion channel domain-containing protein, partial [Polyangiaceae bacterium]
MTRPVCLSDRAKASLGALLLAVLCVALPAGADPAVALEPSTPPADPPVAGPPVAGPPVVALPAVALPASALPVAPPPASTAAVPVVVFNRRVTTLRTTLMGFPPAERARHATLRLNELLARPSPGKVRVVDVPQGKVLMLDESLGLAITPDDADRLGGETLEQAAEAARAALQDIVRETREAHDQRRLLRALWRSAAATALFVMALLLILRVRRWLVRRLAQLLLAQTSRVQVAGATLLDSSRLYGLSRSLVRLASLLLFALLSYEWTNFVLTQFPYSRPWGEQLSAFLLGVFAQLGGGILGAIPDLLVALAIFLLARGLIGAVRPFFVRIEQSDMSGGWLDHDTARATRRFFSAAVWLFATVMAYPYLPGSGSEAFKGMSVLVGLMVTLGGSSLFGQAASGMIILYSRTLRLGELVRIGDQEGTVTELGIFTTRIRSGLGEDVTLPNSLVLSSVTKNYSHPVRGGGFVMDATVTIGYDAPWRQVEAMLIEAARRTEGVLSERPPEVFKRALSDYYVEYRLVCQASPTEARARAEAVSALNGNVMDVFNEYGVQIMSPHYFSDPAKPKVVPPSAWYPAPAAPAPPQPTVESAGAGPTKEL